MAEEVQASVARQVRPFSDALREIRDGELIEELSDKLNQLVNAVQTTEKGGELTLKIVLTPEKGSPAIFVADKVTVKLPELPRGRTVMFGTEQGNLQRKNPKQKEFELRDASKTDSPLREAPAPAAAR